MIQTIFFVIEKVNFDPGFSRRCRHRVSGNTFFQGRMEFGKFCSNVTYSDNNFVNSGFLRFKEVAVAENISVWAQINSQL